MGLYDQAKNWANEPARKPTHPMQTPNTRQSLPFMFECYDKKSAEYFQYILPINPEAYRLIPAFRATVTQTLDGAFEDNIGLGLPRCALQGTFGFVGTLAIKQDGTQGAKHARHLKGDKKTGFELFKEIEGAMLAFYSRFGTYSSDRPADAYDPATGNIPTLRFYNYSDKDYFEVQLNKFDILRSVQRRFLYQYDIQMTVLRRLNEPTVSEDHLWKKLYAVEPPRELTTLETLIDIYKTANAVMSKVQTTVQDLKSTMTRISTAVSAFVTGSKSMILAPFSLVTSAIATVDDIINTVASISDLPHEITHELRGIKRELLGLTFHSDKFADDTGSTATASSGRSSRTEVLTVAPGSPGAFMDIPETTLFGATETPVARAASEAPILGNDTIETVAQRMLGDARRWQELAALNGLEYPYLVRNRRDRYGSELATWTLDSDIPAGERFFVAPSQLPSGSLVILGDFVEEAQVDTSAITGDTWLLNPLSAAFPAGTRVVVYASKKAVLVAGDRILLPANSQIKAVLGDSINYLTSLFGTDEELEGTGDHPADTFGDVRAITGYANLQMQLQHRLATTRGELAALGHPDYGSIIPTLVGKAGEDMWYERIKLEAEITILQDPRVRKVENLTMMVEGTTVYIEADIVPINQTSSVKMSLVVG